MTKKKQKKEKYKQTIEEYLSIWDSPELIIKEFMVDLIDYGYTSEFVGKKTAMLVRIMEMKK